MTNTDWPVLPCVIPSGHVFVCMVTWCGLTRFVFVQIPRGSSPTMDDWEIDISQLHIDAKVAAGSFSNLYKG